LHGGNCLTWLWVCCIVLQARRHWVCNAFEFRLVQTSSLNATRSMRLVQCDSPNLAHSTRPVQPGPFNPARPARLFQPTSFSCGLGCATYKISWQQWIDALQWSPRHSLVMVDGAFMIYDHDFNGRLLTLRLSSRGYLKELRIHTSVQSIRGLTAKLEMQSHRILSSQLASNAA
jgi:hypothetical protein